MHDERGVAVPSSLTPDDKTRRAQAAGGSIQNPYSKIVFGVDQDKQTDFDSSHVLASNNIPSSHKLSRTDVYRNKDPFNRFSKSFEKVYSSKQSRKKPFLDPPTNPDKIGLKFLPGLKQKIN